MKGSDLYTKAGRVETPPQMLETMQGPHILSQKAGGFASRMHTRMHIDTYLALLEKPPHSRFGCHRKECCLKCLPVHGERDLAGYTQPSTEPLASRKKPRLKLN